MINEEYLRFLQTLTESQIPEGVYKIANLVLEHLEILQPLTIYQGCQQEIKMSTFQDSKMSPGG